MKVIAIIFMTVFFSACSVFQPAYTNVYCPPDNKPVTVYKDPTKSYSPYVRELDGGFEGLKGTLKNIDTEFGIGKGNIKVKVQHLEDKLNQESSRLRLNLQTAALAMNVSPCDAKPLFDKQITELNKSLNTIYQVQTSLKDAVLQSEGKSDSEKEKIINDGLEKASESVEKNNEELVDKTQKKSPN